MNRPNDPFGPPPAASDLGHLFRPARDHALATAREALLTFRSLLDAAVNSIERMAQTPPGAQRAERGPGPVVDAERTSSAAQAPNEDV